MVDFRHGMHVISGDAIVEEALEALPFVNRKYWPGFGRLISKIWDTGIAERLLMKADLPDDFFVEHEGYNEYEALGAIINRISFSIYREARWRDIEKQRKRGYYTHARCSAITDYTCAAARPLDGRIVPLDQLIKFPLPECNADWCACSWRFLSPREMKK